jgi:hypothetical protein
LFAVILMPEVPPAGEYHREPVFVSRGNHFGVAH